MLCFGERNRYGNPDRGTLVMLDTKITDASIVAPHPELLRLL